MASSTLPSPLYEQFYNFPPFFTLQPTPATKSRQLDLWTKLLQSHCKSSNQFILTRTEPVFTNASLQRSLSNDFITELFRHMLSTGNALPNIRSASTTRSASPQHSIKGKGHSAEGAEQVDSIIILFMAKEKWFEKLYDYAKRNGLQNGGIATAYEILNDEEFSGMNDLVLEVLLRGMMKETRQCEVMEGTTGSIDGVKFF